MQDHTIDTLAEFHMQNPDNTAYALIAHLISVLENHEGSDQQKTWRNISNILGEMQSERILHLMCQIDHIDYAQLIQDCQSITLTHISPRLMLHLAILPVSYVSKELQIDDYWSEQLLEQFHKQFTIDNPIVWLKRFLSITEKERLRYGHEKQDLLLGRAVVNAPIDTAEERRIKHSHRLRPDLEPPGSR